MLTSDLLYTETVSVIMIVELLHLYLGLFFPGLRIIISFNLCLSVVFVCKREIIYNDE